MVVTLPGCHRDVTSRPLCRFVIVLEQAPGAQSNNGRPPTASIDLISAGSSAVWSVAGSSAGGSAFRRAGSFAGSGARGAQEGGTGDRDIGTGKKVAAVVAKVI